MECLNYSEKMMNELSCFWTATEIAQQPATWMKTIHQIDQCKEELKEFMTQVLKHKDYDVILTGAGTSEFVGNSICVHLNRLCDGKVKSIGTTDLVSAPQDYFHPVKPTLLISFARSGNSPESVGAVDAANVLCENIYHLMITCNKEGALSKAAAQNERAYALNLTPETCDQSFAMTSSYSNMALAALLCFHLDDLDQITEGMKTIIDSGTEFLKEGFNAAEQIVDEFDFQRIVYLGANDLKGTAQESALKMLELTAGQVVTMHDSPLGFRHGPKSIVNDETLTVILLSSNEYARKYELDLLKEMSLQRKKNRIVVLCTQTSEELEQLTDKVVCFNHFHQLDNALLGLNYILFAQVLALKKSLSLGIGPDNPCPTGEVNRVVKGVVIYPVKK